MDEHKLPQWAGRVHKWKIKRIYDDDAQGLHDLALLDEVGYGLLARCQSFIAAVDAVNGRAACPRCGAIIRHNRDKAELLVCAGCDWSLTWGDYFHTIQHKQLSGAEPVLNLFRDFMQRYPSARTGPQKMLVIDALLHGFHWWLIKNAPTRTVAVNLIEGSLTDVVLFLDGLTYGVQSTPGLVESYRRWRDLAAQSFIADRLPGRSGQPPQDNVEEREMTDWFETDVVANGIRLHYYRTGGEQGSGKPQLVLCHGLSDSALCWTQFARRFEADYDIVMVDARCHGRSEAPREGNTAEAMGADLVAMIESLGLDRPVCMGHSMGANYVPYAAAMAPAAMRAVILEDPPWLASGFYYADEAEAQARLAAWREGFITTKAMSWDELEAKTRADAPGNDADTLRAVVQAKYDLDVRVACDGFLGSRSWRDVLADIQCPVLLLSGEPERGGIVTPDVAEEAERIHPQLSHRHASGVGHLLHYNQLDWAVATVHEWLSQL